MTEIRDDLKTRIDDIMKGNAESFLEAIITQAEHNKQLSVEDGSNFSVEESLLQKYEICRHNGCSSSEFHHELLNYACAALKESPPYEFILFGLGTSQSAVGAIMSSPFMVVAGGALGVYGLFLIYKRKMVSNKFKRFRNIVEYYKGHPGVFDEVLRKYKND